MLAAVTFVSLGVITLNKYFDYVKAHEKAQQELQRVHDTDSYTKGFWAGVNSVQRHIQFNTNSGRFTLELTNVLSDLKP